MDIKLRKKLLDLAGYTHHPEGTVINGIRWNWTDIDGEPLNLPPMLNSEGEVHKYLKDFLKKADMSVVMVLTYNGTWRMNLVEKSTSLDRKSFVGTNFNDLVAEMILEVANG